jgi:hypothetical protein
MMILYALATAESTRCASGLMMPGWDIAGALMENNVPLFSLETGRS